MRFWDSSAVVPLVVSQSGSRAARNWLAADSDLIVWTLTEVEIVSALRRLTREKRLAESASIAAEAHAHELLEYAHAVIDIEVVKTIAQRVLRIHDLRAADSLQLAAGLAWADGAPAGLIFHTLDQRLGLAAQREGFTVEPPLAD